MPLVPIGPPKVKKTAPQWAEMTIVFRQPAGNLLTEDGIRYGTLAVHPSLNPSDPAVTVTHLPTKLAVIKVKEVNCAVAFTEQLWDRCSEAFSRPGDDVDRSKIPANVLQWILRCSAQQRLVD